MGVITQYSKTSLQLNVTVIYQHKSIHSIEILLQTFSQYIAIIRKGGFDEQHI